jgi:hypothetical protein
VAHCRPSGLFHRQKLQAHWLTDLETFSGGCEFAGFLVNAEEHDIIRAHVFREEHSARRIEHEVPWSFSLGGRDFDFG